MFKRVTLLACFFLLTSALVFSEVCTAELWLKVPKWTASIDYGNGRIENKEFISKGPTGFAPLTDFITYMEEQGWKIEYYSATYGNAPHHYFIFRR
jgi:hypothetical protein